MIQHIFKIIWNERKINTWLVVEYILIFCILWFCCDYLYTMLRSYYGPQGYDIKHVYILKVGEKPDANVEGEDKYTLAMTFLDRVKRYPDIESVSLSDWGVPYGGGESYNLYKLNSDSIDRSFQVRLVSSGFFDVFKIHVEGQVFDWTDIAAKDDAIISLFREDKVGSIWDGVDPFPVSELHTIRYDNEWDGNKSTHKVIGIADKIKNRYDVPFMSNIILPLKREEVNLIRDEIAYFLSTVTSLEEMKAQMDMRRGIKSEMNSLFAITLFLFLNIFLGILGSFWFRTQSRRSEIGLRMALGSSGKKVQGMLILETLLLLFIASMVATIICLNLGDPETLDPLGIPTVDKKSWGIGVEQHFINFAITFGFLAIVSVLAVWYPAQQAAKMQPAEVLHDE